MTYIEYNGTRECFEPEYDHDGNWSEQNAVAIENRILNLRLEGHSVSVHDDNYSNRVDDTYPPIDRAAIIGYIGEEKFTEMLNDENENASYGITSMTMGSTLFEAIAEGDKATIDDILYA